ncbi:hypothetical protein Aca07nite_51300 [Actinoplanes capillaceus]|uniref:Cysteine desulfurase n=1 Tax=Actinoplanes campanulatus TaxID=113559 RepID=A0ABQ3WNL8_9ACTN|nr:hypothetical protein [Actinoplanes capillaceus]GID47855.1 hypothetical protein Aca07nite_51300 [Actinoplanes capillaceus]
MSIDVTAVRAHFPSPAGGLALFDAPGGTQTPRPVADAITATLTGPLSNRGTVSVSELNAERSVAEFRAAQADLLGVPATGVVHGRSATQLTYDFSRPLAGGAGGLQHRRRGGPVPRRADRLAQSLTGSDSQ